MTIQEIAKKMVADHKGLLAADESTGSIKKKLEKYNIEDSVENHRRYRQMLFTTPGIEEYVSGVIMYDETIRQSTDLPADEAGDGKSFPDLLAERDIMPGIKVDTGKVPAPFFSGEFVTEGLDGLRDRLKEYLEMGAKFTKWRAVIHIGSGKPSQAVLHANANSLARYAGFVQEAGMVPIVEPEVLMDGDHDIETCEIVTRIVLNEVFTEIMKQKVSLQGMILKPNMIVPGKDSPKKATHEEIAEATLRVFSETVPKEVPGIMFLSGGQSSSDAIDNLRIINKMKSESHPWEISFSYGRALQDGALKEWAGQDANVEQAQKILIDTAKADSLATKGE